MLMKQPTPTHSKNYETAENACDDETPLPIIGMISRQLDIAEDARHRIEREGIVVRDIRGTVVAHPAIEIENKATKLAHELIVKHKKNEGLF